MNKVFLIMATLVFSTLSHASNKEKKEDYLLLDGKPKIIEKKEQQPKKYSLIDLYIGNELSDITECNLVKSNYDNRYYTYDENIVDKYCFKRTILNINNPNSVVSERIQINYSKEQLKEFSYVENSFIQLIDNKIEEIYINTLGLEYQNIIFNDLINKFGQPSKVINDKGFGETIINASWELDDTVELLFFGAAYKETSGIIKLSTLKARELKKRNKPKL